MEVLEQELLLETLRIQPDWHVNCSARCLAHSKHSRTVGGRTFWGLLWLTPSTVRPEADGNNLCSKCYLYTAAVRRQHWVGHHLPWPKTHAHACTPTDRHLRACSGRLRSPIHTHSPFFQSRFLCGIRETVMRGLCPPRACSLGRRGWCVVGSVW